MMGRTHATSGAVLALAALPLLRQAGFPAEPLTVVTYAVAAAGAAMLPDFDHRHATVAHSLGPVSKAVAVGVETISGGHRNGTHSLLGVAGFTGVALMVGNLAAALSWLGVEPFRADLVGRIVTAVWLAFLFAVATTALRVAPVRNQMMWSVLCLVGGLMLAASTWWGHIPLQVVPVAVAIGVVAHIAGDMLTKEGCPLLWPVSKMRFKVANFTTDHFFERNVLGPVLGVVVVAQIVALSGWWPWTWAQMWGAAGTLWTQLAA